MCPNGVPETSVASTIQSTLAAALSVEGDGLIEGRLHRVAVVGFRVSVSIPYTCRYAVRWLSGRKPRFAKAAGSHGTGLKSTISGRFFIGSLVGVGCRMMGVGPRAGTLGGHTGADANVCLSGTRCFAHRNGAHTARTSRNRWWRGRPRGPCHRRQLRAIRPLRCERVNPGPRASR